jgi:hypothetical protein
MTGFADTWDGSLLGDLVGTWITRGYMTGALMDVENLVNVVHQITQMDASVCIRSVTVAPRLIVPDEMPSHPEHGSISNS